MSPQLYVFWWICVFAFFLKVADSAAKEIGCFKDNPRSRALSLSIGIVCNVKQCVDECGQLKQTYAGLQNGFRCWCGEDYHKYGKASNCDKKCISGEVCGGSLANTVYKVLSKKNPCQENPCQNGGTCKIHGENSKCSCKKGFVGKHCEKGNPCRLGLCLNGGSCKVVGANYKCSCKYGYYGNRCEKGHFWLIRVYTPRRKYAGTDAAISMLVYGNNGKSGVLSLKGRSENFERGSVDEFKRYMNDLGIPYKIRIWHNNHGKYPGWFLGKVELVNVATKKQYTFYCNRWLATNDDDRQILRELPATGGGITKPLPVIYYKVEVYTGNVGSAGTDANVFLNIFGDLGDTGERLLKYSKTNRDKFERGKVDVFHIEAVTLKNLKKIKIGHDNRGSRPGWFLDKVIITPSNDWNHRYTFYWNQWLARDERDGSITCVIFAR